MPAPGTTPDDDDDDIVYMITDNSRFTVNEQLGYVISRARAGKHLESSH